MIKAQRENLPHTLSRWWRDAAVAALGRIAVVGNSLLAKLVSLPHKWAEAHGYMFLFFANVRAVLNLSLECWQRWASYLCSSLVGLTGPGYHSNLPITHLQGYGNRTWCDELWNVQCFFILQKNLRKQYSFRSPCDACRHLQFLLPWLKNKCNLVLFSVLCGFRTIILNFSWIFCSDHWTNLVKVECGNFLKKLLIFLVF